MADSTQTVSIIIDTQRKNAQALGQAHADLQKVNAEVEKAKKALDGTAASSERLGRALANQSRAKQALAEATGKVTSTTNELSNVLSLLPGRLGQVATQASSTASTMAGLQTTTATVVVGIGAAIAGFAALGAAVLTAARSAADYQEKMNILADRTGLTTGELYGLKVAAQESGRSFTEIEPAIDFFNRKLGEAARGNQEAAIAFAALGVSIREANGEVRPTGDVLQEVGDRLRNIENRSERAAAAFDLFGRSGARVLGVLISQWKETNVLSEEMETNLTELDATFDRLATSVEAAKISLLGLIGVNVLPWVKNLEAVVAVFEKLATVPKVVGFGDVRREERGRTFEPLGPAAPSTDEWALINSLAERRATSEKAAADELERQLRILNEMSRAPVFGPSSEEFFQRQRNPFLDQRSTELMTFGRPADIAGTSVSIEFSEAERATREYQEALADATGETVKASDATADYSSTLSSGFSSFISSAIRGVGNIGDAFKGMVVEVLATIAAQGLVKGIFGGILPFQDGGSVLRAQGGMLLSGIRGRDTVPVLAGRGETIISHHLTDRLDRFLMTAQRGQSARPANAPVNVTLNFQSNVVDRAQLKAWFDEEAVPVIRRSIATGSARAY